MPISINESTSEKKSIDVTVTPSASGVTVFGSVRWVNDVLYQIPSVVIPCVYVDDETYRVVLASAPPRLVLAEKGTTIPDEVCYLARWSFTKATDTCATVTIEVPKRTLTPDPDRPVPTNVAVSATPVLPGAASTEKARGRRKRRRIRNLTEDLRVLREAGTTYSAMTANDRQKVQELCALMLDLPMEVP